MDENGPDLHKDEQTQVSEFLQWEEEGENVVGKTLHKAVYRMESNRGVGGWHDPLVVRLMQMLIDQRVVQTAVDEVDAEIGEDQEHGELQPVVIGEGLVGESVVELRVTTDFTEEERRGHDCNPRHGIYSLTDFHSDLVLEKLGVLESSLVKDEYVGERRDDEVHGCAENPCYQEQCDQLSIGIVSRPLTLVSSISGRPRVEPR